MAEVETAETIFEQFVHRAERQADGSISAYKFRLALFAVLGYVVIIGVLGVLVALVGGMVAASIYSTALLIILIKKKLIFLIIPAIWILMKSLWVKLEAPSGYRLTKKECPQLFDEIESLRRSLKALKIHEVILTADLNAAINQTPRLGVFGWQKNTLILGLELLLTLSPEQARAVVAHEFGHLSGNHSKFSGWIYRIRQTWYRIMYGFHEQASLGANLMKRFFDWYAPRFAAYSFVLARRNEYEADAIAASLTSAAETGAALINSHVAGPYVDEHYWAEYFKLADSTPEPDHPPWIGLSRFLQTHTVAHDELQKKLDAELNVSTGLDDTHPSLSDRIAALDLKPSLPGAVATTAAEAWFGEQFATIINAFDNDWMASNASKWSERFDYVTAGRARITELNAIEKNKLGVDELWELASLSEELTSNEIALPLYKLYETREPSDPDVAYKLGQLLFERDDETCLSYFKKALERPGLAIDSCRYAYHYLMEREREDDAQWWLDAAERQSQIDAESNAEREMLAPKDKLEKTSIDDELLKTIKDALQQYPEIKNAWIAQKPMQHYPEIPAVAIAITVKGMFGNASKVAAKISETLALNCTFYVVGKHGDLKALAKSIAKAGDQII